MPSCLLAVRGGQGNGIRRLRAFGYDCGWILMTEAVCTGALLEITPGQQAIVRVAPRSKRPIRRHSAALARLSASDTRSCKPAVLPASRTSMACLCRMTLRQGQEALVLCRPSSARMYGNRDHRSRSRGLCSRMTKRSESAFRRRDETEISVVSPSCFMTRQMSFREDDPLPSKC